MDKNRRTIIAGLSLATLGAATGHAAPAPLAQGIQASGSGFVLGPVTGGKGTGAAFSAVLSFRGTVVVIDPKGGSFTDPGAEGPSGD